ncbi:hypothetical protein B0I35DRAFT_477956 [Stachybotrys elegans]|uniref:Uncharacterized protein n=1 Tax=Stachybotrys elegans TaxID=80388 RepID=A0A8K0SX78_9HYPO|nr:hypothetical protein B0I35DRAFT_477956 [Stachybotrys elegans]
MGGPPPPPPPPSFGSAASSKRPQPPLVPPQGPPGAFLVELVVYNGSPFKDHWAYFVRSRQNAQVGVLVHATGDVRNGFRLEYKRMLDFDVTASKPTSRIPLQWVEGQYFNERAMLNNGVYKSDNRPVCRFEESASKIAAPGKSLNSASDMSSGKKVVQRNCQTWVVESAYQLTTDGIFLPEVAAYLNAIKQ